MELEGRIDIDRLLGVIIVRSIILLLVLLGVNIVRSLKLLLYSKFKKNSVSYFLIEIFYS